MTVLFEHQFSLDALVLILSPPSILSSFSLILRHDESLVDICRR